MCCSFSNAFNTVDRASLLRETRLRLPGLSPWAEWCYGHHSRLLFQGTPLSSEAGVQQGDPLGPLLFALALQPALQAACSSGPTDLRPSVVVAYLDDVCMAGTYRQVSAGLVRLTAAARQVGLQVNPAKCELVACGGAAASVDLAFFPNGMPFNQSGAFSLLGAPIGDAGFCNEFTAAERVNKALPLVEELAVLGDAQTTLLLLRQCASYCRMVYSTRVTPPMGLAPALQSFDTAVRGCLEAGCSGPLTPEAWMQASLSTRSGGLGLRSVARHSVAGYAASLLATAPLCKEIDGNYDADQGAALHQVNLALPPADHFPVPAPHPPRQQELSRALDRVVIAQLAAPGPGREAYRAPFQLLQQEGAGAWLHAFPNDALGLHVVTPLFRTMVRLRLRLPIADSDMACPLCDGTSDSFGDHARVCPCGATGSRDTTSCATSWQGVPALLACNRKSRNRTCSLRGRSSRGAPKMDHSLVEMAVAQLMSGSPTGTFMALPLSMLRSLLACGKATLLLQPLMAAKRAWITKFGSATTWTRCRPAPLRACNSFRLWSKPAVEAGGPSL